MPKKHPFIPAGLGERFKNLRAELRLNQSNMANLLGISQSALSLIERGEAPIPFEAICSLASKFPDLDLRQILLGTKTSLLVKASDINSHVTPIIRLITAPVDDIRDGQMADDYLAVPLLDGKVAAGSGCFLWDQVQSLVWVYRPEIGNHCKLIAVRVSGDSMRPTIPDGAIVIIDLDRKDPKGDRRNVWAIRTDREGAIAIKRLQAIKGQPGFMVLSDNFSEYPPEIAWTCEPNELVVGKVVWMWRSLD